MPRPARRRRRQLLPLRLLLRPLAGAAVEDGGRRSLLWQMRKPCNSVYQLRLNVSVLWLSTIAADARCL